LSHEVACNLPGGVSIQKVSDIWIQIGEYGWLYGAIDLFKLFFLYDSIASL